MRITVTTDKTGTRMVPLAVNEEMEMENFIVLCQLEVPEFAEQPLNSFSLSHNGRMIVMTATSLKKTFKDFGIKDNDTVMLSATAIASGSKRPRTSDTASSSSGSTNQQKLIADLIKGIKVPTASTSRYSGLGEPVVSQLRQSFDACRSNAAQLSELRHLSADLANAVDKNDFEAFCSVYVADRERAVTRQRAMMDPTSIEGQRLIAEEIERANINYSHEFAMEHMPEAYIPVTMLYIRMKINGVEVKAFVDSGAQVSILSETTAQRCNLMRLVDKRFQNIVHGVGGQQKILGKIHTCQVQIEKEFFPCNFDVISDHSIDILLGLDILRRHQCMIDLKNSCLRIGDIATTPFLSDAEVPKRNFEQVKSAEPETSSGTVTADDEKLASLIALGFEEEAARAMLIQCGNDLEMAASNLLARQTALS